MAMQTVKSILCAAFALLAIISIPSGFAQAPTDMPNKAELAAAMTLVVFDAVKKRCDGAGGFSRDDAAKIDNWSQTNRADAMRVRVNDLQSVPAVRAEFDKAARYFTDLLDSTKVDPCAVAVKIIEEPDAQFARFTATVSPPSSRSSRRGGSAAPGAAKPAPVTPAITANTGQIDSFGFDSRPAMGVGGFLSTDVFPVVLFRDGTALTDITGLENATMHRRANPEKWTSWRRGSSRVELMKNGEWKPLAFSQTYASLPRGFRLDGVYRLISGTGNIAVFGTDSVSVVNEYRFWPDGTVLRGGSASASTTLLDSSAVTRSTSPSARGQYRIDGLSIVMTYDDGSTERQTLVADPEGGPTTIWLNGKSFVRPRS